jgi:hypothetical protein
MAVLNSELPPVNLQKAENDRNPTAKKQKVFSYTKKPFFTPVVDKN